MYFVPKGKLQLLTMVRVCLNVLYDSALVGKCEFWRGTQKYPLWSGTMIIGKRFRKKGTGTLVRSSELAI